jgi:hypothetical protein
MKVRPLAILRTIVHGTDEFADEAIKAAITAEDGVLGAFADTEPPALLRSTVNSIPFEAFQTSESKQTRDWFTLLFDLQIFPNNSLDLFSTSCDYYCIALRRILWQPSRNNI